MCVCLCVCMCVCACVCVLMQFDLSVYKIGLVSLIDAATYVGLCLVTAPLYDRLVCGCVGYGQLTPYWAGSHVPCSKYIPQPLLPPPHIMIMAHESQEGDNCCHGVVLPYHLSFSQPPRPFIITGLVLCSLGCFLIGPAPYIGTPYACLLQKACFHLPSPSLLPSPSFLPFFPLPPSLLPSPSFLPSLFPSLSPPPPLTDICGSHL